MLSHLEGVPLISPSWRTDWDRLTVLFDSPPEIRWVMYTAKAIESLHYTLRKRLKTRGLFTSNSSLGKVLY